MKKLPKNAFDDFEDKHLIWGIYGELLDFYTQQNFCALQVANEIGYDKKLINKVIHRLIKFKAIKLVGLDCWGVKTYRINDEFAN